jgi:hypothetical protein
MDARSARERVRGGHASDQGLDLGVNGRTTPGRPTESWVQYARKRRRCHRRTVSGGTKTRVCLQPVQTLASQTQKRRSIVRSLSRGAVRL